MEISDSNIKSSDFNSNAKARVPKKPEVFIPKEVHVNAKKDVKGAHRFQKSKVFIAKANKIVNIANDKVKQGSSKAVTAILTDLRSKVAEQFSKAAEDSPTKKALGDLQSKIESVLTPEVNSQPLEVSKEVSEAELVIQRLHEEISDKQVNTKSGETVASIKGVRDSSSTKQVSLQIGSTGKLVDNLREYSKGKQVSLKSGSEREVVVKLRDKTSGKAVSSKSGEISPEMAALRKKSRGTRMDSKTEGPEKDVVVADLESRTSRQQRARGSRSSRAKVEDTTSKIRKKVHKDKKDTSETTNTTESTLTQGSLSEIRALRESNGELEERIVDIKSEITDLREKLSDPLNTFNQMVSSSLMQNFQNGSGSNHLTNLQGEMLDFLQMGGTGSSSEGASRAKVATENYFNSLLFENDSLSEGGGL